MNRRLQLHEKLCEILGCPSSGTTCRVYFQPPASVQMKYPAIVYSLDEVNSHYADDNKYIAKRRYVVTVIDKNPDSEFIDKTLKLPLSRFNRSYVSENLNHFTFEVYY